MHEAAYDFVKQAVSEFGPFTSVAEFGSHDINGTVRPLFDGSAYVGIDLEPGPGVDFVADATAWRPDAPIDCVVCCEVFEHLVAWRKLIDSAACALRPGGTLIITAAGPGRGPHSAFDGNAVRPGEHYANIEPDELAAYLSVDFDAVRVVYEGFDVKAIARRK